MTVKVFRSTDFGAPANTNAAGALIAILDACLVNGYGSQTVTITSAAGVATVTTPVAHALKNDTFMRISGANEAEYNGDFAITVTGATTFTYPITGTPATPATGTIASKVSPADWTKPFSGTNKAAYKQGTGSNGFYFRISDTTTSFARVKAFEAMTDIDTGTGDFPTEAQLAGGGYLMKSGGSTPSDWIIVATEKLFYFVVGGSLNSRTVHFFGDFISKKSGDTFNTVLNAYGNPTDYSSQSNRTYIARSYTQIGASKQASIFTGTNQSYIGGSSGIATTYPNPIDNSLHLSQVMVLESSPVITRGILPGFWNPIHDRPFSNNDIIVGTGDFSGKKFIALLHDASGQVLLEISNTW